MFHTLQCVQDMATASGKYEHHKHWGPHAEDFTACSLALHPSSSLPLPLTPPHKLSLVHALTYRSYTA